MSEVITLGEGVKKENCDPIIKCECGYHGIVKEKDKNIDSFLKYRCPKCNKKVDPKEVLKFTESTEQSIDVELKEPEVNIINNYGE